MFQISFYTNKNIPVVDPEFCCGGICFLYSNTKLNIKT